MTGVGAISTVFNESTDAETVAHSCEKYCIDKFIVVTGASVGGIGFEVARVLAKYDAEVFLCCRTIEACEEAVCLIQEAYPDAKVLGHPLDLSSFLSIQRCANYILARRKPIHVLINNAGIMETTTKLTVDNYEMQWQVNFLGPFYLTQLLLPLLMEGGKSLQHPARVIMTSSIMNNINIPKEGIDFTPLLNEKLLSDPLRRYSESKLANIMIAKELSFRMMKGYHGEETDEFDEFISASPVPMTASPWSNVIAVSVHPGITLSTKLLRSLSVTSTLSMALQLLLKDLLRKEKRKTIPQGAATTIFAALHPSILPGLYYADCDVCHVFHPQAEDEESWKKLWDISEQMIATRLKRIEEVQQKVLKHCKLIE